MCAGQSSKVTGRGEVFISVIDYFVIYQILKADVYSDKFYVRSSEGVRHKSHLCLVQSITRKMIHNTLKRTTTNLTH